MVENQQKYRILEIFEFSRQKSHKNVHMKIEESNVNLQNETF